MKDMAPLKTPKRCQQMKGGATLQVDQGLDGSYGIGSHELDATLGKVSGYEVANGDGVEVETIARGRQCAKSRRC